MGDRRFIVYGTGSPLAGGAPLHGGGRGLPCRYGCRAPAFSAPGMAGSLAILRDVARARDEHERAAHGAVYRVAELSSIGAPSERERAAHVAGGRARWARKGRDL